MNTLKKTARTAGILYLTYILIMILGSVIGYAPLIKSGEAAATAANIMAHEWQFRMGFIIDLITGVLFFLVAWALYALLKPVDHNLALLFLLLNLGGVVVQCVSDLFLFAPLVFLNGGAAFTAFQTDQLQALALAFIDLHKNGFMIAQIFFGAWVFPLGYLVYKSGFLPKILGIVLMVECFCWLLYPFQFFLFPAFTAVTYLSFPVGFMAEFGLTLWLVVKGVKDQKPAAQG